MSLSERILVASKGLGKMTSVGRGLVLFVVAMEYGKVIKLTDGLMS